MWDDYLNGASKVLSSHHIRKYNILMIEKILEDYDAWFMAGVNMKLMTTYFHMGTGA